MALKEFKCELSWSASRAREFNRCKRENWYARYGSWAWWKEQPRGEKFEAMVHKRLTSLPAFAGDCVHRAIEKWFHHQKNGVDMTQEELYEESRELFREGWRQSSTKSWEAQPNKSVHLEEHHYNEDIPAAFTDRAKAILEESAAFFCQDPAIAPVREAHPDSWRAVETLDSYQFLGTKVYAVPDFAYIDNEFQVHVWDWKTGRPREEDDFQLLTYALFACEKWGADPESIHLHAAYLAKGEVKSSRVDIDQLSEVQDQMSQSVREMQEIHYDPETDPFVEANWPTSGAPHACGRCRFRAICPGARSKPQE
ncbi:MAG: PD-(D/E)XK nuclease family protein [Planctomycetes bacterium]|nr:PD-(D/E)XK nuclease family protein [Planctomycetota bacterium]